MTEKMAVVAPIPSASVTTAAAVTRGTAAFPSAHNARPEKKCPSDSSRGHGAPGWERAYPAEVPRRNPTGVLARPLVLSGEGA